MRAGRTTLVAQVVVGAEVVADEDPTVKVGKVEPWAR